MGATHGEATKPSGASAERGREMDENEISGIILDAAIMVHNELGGLGIVINFGQKRIIEGWERVANHMPQ